MGAARSRSGTGAGWRSAGRYALLALVPLLLIGVAEARQTVSPFEAEIVAYEEQDRTNPPPQGGIVFVGSSSIKGWDLSRYFPGYTTINRGIWSSYLSDAVRFADRIVIPLRPRTVVVYAGDNDIYAGLLSEQVAVQFEQLVRVLRAKLPAVRIVFISIKPSLQRWAVMERMRMANALIRAYAAGDDNVAFVDVEQAMLGWDEQPRRELFVSDGLHLTPEGYELWSTLLRPLLGTPDVATR